MRRNRICCIYIAYPNKSFKYDAYLRKKELYNVDNTRICYSIYNHSFDGGDSYTEFDDE